VIFSDDGTEVRGAAEVASPPAEGLACPSPLRLCATVPKLLAPGGTSAMAALAPAATYGYQHEPVLPGGLPGLISHCMLGS
jgi:hypothetical protein